MSVLNLSELIPERDTLDMGNGVNLEFISRAEMDVEDLAKMQKMRRSTVDAQKRLEKAETEQAALAAAKKVNDVLGDLLQLIIPDLTDDQLAALRMGQRGQIITWWTERHKEADAVLDPNGVGAAGPPAAN
jgi:hypothetical protein